MHPGTSENVRHLLELGYEDPLEIDRCAALRQRNFDVQLQQAIGWLTQRDWDKGEAMLVELIRQEPGWTAPRRAAAQLLCQTHRYAAALEQLDWLEQHGMEHHQLALWRAQAAIALRQWDVALENARYAHFLGGPAAASALVTGEVHLRRRDLEAADREFVLAEGEAAYAARGLAGRAAVELGRGAWEEAIDLSLASLALNMDAGSCHYRLGIALAMTEQWSDATVAFETSARLRPEWAAPWRWLESVADQQGDATHAERYRNRGREVLRRRRSAGQRVHPKHACPVGS